jgi:transposase
MELKRIAIDTSKHVFTLHGVDQAERPVLRCNLRRGQMEGFFAKQPATELVLEACGSSHHWGRTLAALGHQVRLIAPQYVKPFVKRGKNDRNDAAAISAAASRPDMRFVPVKSADTQAQAMVLSARELLVKQRTQLINAVRGHAAEFGLIAARGTANVAAILAKMADTNAGVPARAQQILARLGRQIDTLDREIDALEKDMATQHKASADSRRLATAPGVGPIVALTLTLCVDPTQFENGRHFAAWLGLTPREKSTGGKQRLGKISREGNERIRQCLVLGATSVIKAVARNKASKLATPWLLNLLERKPRKLAAVALANKMARIVWAMMSRGEAYRRPTPLAA